MGYSVANILKESSHDNLKKLSEKFDGVENRFHTKLVDSFKAAVLKDKKHTGEILEASVATVEGFKEVRDRMVSYVEEAIKIEDSSQRHTKISEASMVYEKTLNGLVDNLEIATQNIPKEARNR